MATSDREVHVKITADASEYLAALDQMRAAVHELRAAGVKVEDIPSALAGATKLAEAGALNQSSAVGVVAAAIKAFDLTSPDLHRLADLLTDGS